MSRLGRLLERNSNEAIKRHSVWKLAAGYVHLVYLISPKRCRKTVEFAEGRKLCRNPFLITGV